MKVLADFFVNKFGWVILGCIVGVTFATLAPNCSCKSRVGVTEVNR